MTHGSVCSELSGPASKTVQSVLLSVRSAVSFFLSCV